MTNTPITAGHTIGEWLEHPTGGPAIREMLAASGTDEKALGPALTMPLQQLVALSGGQMPQSVVDDLLRAANGGELPEASGLWVERITPGRFDGQSVVITGAGGGIGLACAQRVVAEGGRVIAVDIDGAKLTAARDAMGQERFVPLALDLTAPGAAQQVGAADGPIDALAPGGVATGIPMQGTMSEFGESRLAPARVIMPGIADAAQLAASITFLLSDDSTNINGAVLTSDGGWSAA